MYESELKEQNTIKERLDTTKRLKYYCNICKSNHFYDTEIGKLHQLIRKSQSKYKISNNDVNNFVINNPPDIDMYSYIEGGCSIHEWLENILLRRSANTELLKSVSIGEVNDIIQEFKDVFAHINYKYDTLTNLLITKIAKEHNKSQYYYQLYEIEEYFKDIQININNIPQNKYRNIYMDDFNEIFDRIYEHIKSRCPQFTKKDIQEVKSLTRKQFIKKIKDHPYIKSKK